MKKGLFRNIFIILLAGIAAFSVFKYASWLKEKYVSLNRLNQMQAQLETLEDDKQRLREELEKEKQLNVRLETKVLKIHRHLQASQERLAKLFQDFGQAKRAIEDLSAKFSILKSENIFLRDESEKMVSRLAGLSEENQSLKTKLSSVSELKKAIRELRKARPKPTRKAKAEEFFEGNRGFLIKDGKSTSAAKIRIEVIPSP